MLIVGSAVEAAKDGGYSSSLISNQLIETCFRPMEHAEAVAAVFQPFTDKHYVQPEGSNKQMPVSVQFVNTDYWKVFNFRFLEGSPFTDADFQSGIRVAVITEALAHRLFGGEEAVGRYVSLNFSSYRISGVVRNVSYVTPRTFAQLWVPYTVDPRYQESFGESLILGQMTSYILAPSSGEVNMVKEEALDNFHRYAGQFPEMELSLTGQPDRHWQSIFRISSNIGPDFVQIALKYGFIFLILLVIPAISLSGMADSRMERRLAEMGVRRVFGAQSGSLMGQVVSENFLFTLLGGGIGLLFSYLLVLVSRNWIMGLGPGSANILPEGTDVMLTPGMLLNLPVFGIALGVCFLLNLLSALLPAWKVSHHEIIYSLNT
jgi:putative ABC transport system permease protein